MTDTVCIGVIAPHGDLAIAEACGEDERDLAVDTQRAMDEMGRRVAAAAPDAVVVATPHNVHVVDQMAVLTPSRVAGRLDGSAVPLEFACPVDRDLALRVHRALNDAGVPAAAVSFGGNNAAESVSPLDWGALIPLWHIARHAPDPSAVVVAPCRDLDAQAHVRAGAAIVRAARDAGRRIAFVASADHGHGHRADGPYGYAPESAVFDAAVVDIVKRGALEELAAMPVEDVRAALADSWWQMLMLHGALVEDGGGFGHDFLAYEAPTYFGMLTAVFERGGR